MRTLAVSISTWVLMLYCVCGVWTKPGPPVQLSFSIGRCSLKFNERALIELYHCLCAGFQTCSVQPSYYHGESHAESIVHEGEAARRGSSPSHYVCQGTCRIYWFSSNVDSFNCHAVKPDERENKCQVGLTCKNSRVDNAYTCRRCIDIRWSKPEEINVSIGHHNLLQHSQCPGEGAVTKRSTSVQTSVDLSATFSNGSAVLSNATTPSGILTSESSTEEGSAASSGVDLVRLIVPLVFGILVLAIGVTAVCVICLRSGKTAGKQRLSEIYLTPVDVIYSSTEFLAQGRASCNGLLSHEGLHASDLDRPSHIARGNAYTDVSFPGSCSQGPAQTSKMHGCSGLTSVHEHAEAENVYADLDKTAGTEEASSTPHYANMGSFLANNSSTKQATSRIVTETGFAKGNRLSQASTNESNYSIINDSANRTDNTLQHSFKCEKAQVVCGDVEGPYKIMKPTTTNVNENTKKTHDSSSSGTKLSNNMVYTKLRDNSERVSNVYDVMVTEADDATFGANFKSCLSSSMRTEDEYIFARCPLHNKQCSEDCLNGNVYENNNSELSAEGTYINNAMISDTMTPAGIYNNCAVDDDKTTEPGSPYVNYTDPESEQAPPPSTCHANNAVTKNHLLTNDYLTLISCARYNNDNVC